MLSNVFQFSPDRHSRERHRRQAFNQANSRIVGASVSRVLLKNRRSVGLLVLFFAASLPPLTGHVISSYEFTTLTENANNAHAT